MSINYIVSKLILIILFKFVLCLYTVDWIKKTKSLEKEIHKWYDERNSFNECVSAGPRKTKFLDFPRDDLEKHEIIRSIWSKYYDCLRSKNEVIRGTGLLPPYTISAFEQSSVRLDCNVCIAPEDERSTVEWYYTESPSKTDSSILVEEDEYRQISGYTNALTFYTVQKYHQGMYQCKIQTDMDAPYFLHIVTPQNEPVLETKPLTAASGPHAQNPMTIRDTQMILWNDWTDWTDCGWCNNVSRRSRLGFCKISLEKNLPNDLKSMVRQMRPEESFDVSKEIIDETETVLEVFSYGIPCRSPLLRKEVLNINIIKSYPTYIETGFCKVPCPSDVIVEVVDKNGQVVDKYNNTAGDFFILQNLPAVPLTPKRVIVYADLNRPYILPCPSKFDTNSPVQWSVNGKIWLKDTVEHITKKRITINDLNQIVFQKVEALDEKIYSCYQRRELVGVVNMELNSEPVLVEEYSFTAKLYPWTMILTLITVIIIISVRMCLNSEKAKIAKMQPIRTRKRKFVEFLKDASDDKYFYPER